MSFSFASNLVHVFFIILIASLLFFVIKKSSGLALKERLIVIISTFTLTSFFGSFLYYEVFYSENSGYDVRDLAIISLDINTFKEHENRLPNEKDFYLSSFLNHSKYFEVKDGKKIFNPIPKSDNPVAASDLKINYNDDSISITYTKKHNKSFIQTGQAYRTCLNFPLRLNQKSDYFKQSKISINGKDVDKKTTEESMKNICYLGKPNQYQITFF